MTHDRMKSRAPLALVAMIAIALPPAQAGVLAQGQTPLAAAVRREAARLVSVAERPVGVTLQPGLPSTPSDWSRVRNLAPGTEMVVTIRGNAAAKAVLLAADDAGLTVVRLTDPALDDRTRTVLNELVSKHPEYFLAAEQGSTFAVGKRIRFGADGVFVAGHKIADLASIIHGIARNHVVEIKAPAPQRNRVKCSAAAYGGFALGGVAGGLAGGAIGDAVSKNKDAGGMSGAAIGMLAGGTVGSTWIYHKCRDQRDAVIYRVSDDATLGESVSEVLRAGLER